MCACNMAVVLEGAHLPTHILILHTSLPGASAVLSLGNIYIYVTDQSQAGLPSLGHIFHSNSCEIVSL